MPLVKIRPPLPYESLEGLLESYRRLNHYQEDGWTRDLLESPERRAVNYLRSQKDLETLVAAFGPDEASSPPNPAANEASRADEWQPSVDDLIELTLHRFAPHYYLPDEIESLPRDKHDWNGPLWEDGASKVNLVGQIMQNAQRICPGCWREHHTLFLPWSLRHVTTCPVHKCLLADHCKCGQVLHFRLATDTCRCCGARLADLTSQDVSAHQESLELTQLVYSAVGCSDGPFPSESLHLPDDHCLRHMHTAAFLRFAVACSQLLASRDPDNPLFEGDSLPPNLRGKGPARLLSSADVAAAHTSMLAMWSLLKGWPDTWHRLLTRIAAMEDRNGGRTPHFAQQLFTSLDNPAFEWLYRAWGDFIHENIGRVPGVSRRYYFYRSIRERRCLALKPLHTLSEVQSTLKLQITNAARKQLGKGNAVGEVRVVASGDRQIYIVDHPAVEALRGELAAEFAGEEAARMLGTNARMVGLLVEAGILACSRDTAGLMAPRFSQHDIVQFLDKWMSHLRIETAPEKVCPDAVHLSDAILRFQEPWMRPIPLLKAIKEGTLIAFRTKDTLSLADVYIELNSLTALDERCKRARYNQGLGRHLTSTDAASLLGTNPQTFKRWVQQGFITPVGIDKQRYLYAPEDIQRAKSQLRLHPRTGKPLLRQGPKAFAELDARREERLQKGRLLATEAAALLGVTLRRFHEWVNQQLVVPIADRRPRLYRREDIVRVRGSLIMNPSTGRPAHRQGLLALAEHQAMLDQRAAENHATAKEAASILGTDLRTFYVWVGQGLITPVPGNKWRRTFARAEIDQVKAALTHNPVTGKPTIKQTLGATPVPPTVTDKRATAKQAASMLGTDLGTFYRWVAQGFITPIPADNGPKMFAQADVERAQPLLARNPITGKPSQKQSLRPSAQPSSVPD